MIFSNFRHWVWCYTKEWLHVSVDFLLGYSQVLLMSANISQYKIKRGTTRILSENIVIFLIWDYVKQKFIRLLCLFRSCLDMNLECLLFFLVSSYYWSIHEFLMWYFSLLQINSSWLDGEIEYGFSCDVSGHYSCFIAKVFLV